MAILFDFNARLDLTHEIKMKVLGNFKPDSAVGINLHFFLRKLTCSVINTKFFLNKTECACDLLHWRDTCLKSALVKVVSQVPQKSQQ